MSAFLRLKLNTTNSRGRDKLRQYSPTHLTSAYQMVKEKGVSIRASAKMHGVPESTLRDRLSNKVSLDVTKSGVQPVLSEEEEAKLCAHLIQLAEVGYGYTRIEAIQLATDYAVSLGKRTTDNPFSFNWFYGFVKRWPELKVVKPSGLSEQRAKCASKQCIEKYFNELSHIITKYDIINKPHNIYNVDEKGINTEYKPPHVVSGKFCKPQSIMAERSKTVTILGAGNAIGHHIPPYFVFPGVRFSPTLMEGKTPGAVGVMTESGWSNASVFKHYLQTHFIKYAQGRDSSETILLLYDGHKSHISLDLVEWASENNIILFVLPPHTSHILQPMDVGCFAPFQSYYNQLCTTFARSNHRCVTKYDVCALACKAYISALCPSNLQSSFKKAGVYPLLSADTMCKYLGSKLTPATLYDSDKEQSVKTDILANDNEDNFFTKRKGSVVQKVVKKRKTVSTVVGGKALEGETLSNLRIYLNESKSQANSVKNGKNSDSLKAFIPLNSSPAVKPVSAKRKEKPVNKNNKKSPQPGPSCINLMQDTFSDTESDLVDDEDCCCVCKSYYVPKELIQETLFIVKWVSCDICGHWVHLKYCTPLRVARKNTEFICNCCKTN